MTTVKIRAINTIEITLKEALMAYSYHKEATVMFFNQSIVVPPGCNVTFEIPVELFKSTYLDPVIVPIEVQVSPEISDAIECKIMADSTTLLYDLYMPTKIFDRQINIVDRYVPWYASNAITLTLSNKRTDVEVPVRIWFTVCALNKEDWKDILDYYYDKIYEAIITGC